MIETVLVATGVVVWLFIGIGLLAFTALCVLPAIWRAVCYAGFSAFADAEEKRLAREIGRARLNTTEGQ